MLVGLTWEMNYLHDHEVNKTEKANFRYQECLDCSNIVEIIVSISFWVTLLVILFY